MSRRNDSSEFIALVLIGGPALVVWGLRRLALKRHIENTPTSKIRSAAMGHVEFAGIARQRKPLLSPLSNLQCCWWQCQVQELRRSGKNSHWATIRTIGSVDFFYLDDMTGHVLVNPTGAELNVLNSQYPLNAATRTKLSPLLASWGVNDMSWFGMNKEMRILEESLPDCAPVYIAGELALTRDQLKDRQIKLRERLRLLKADPDAMRAADTSGDGHVSAEEWDAYRLKQEETFLAAEVANNTGDEPQEHMMVKAPASGPYLISTGTEADVVGRMGWTAPLSMFGGLALTAGGVYWACAEHWSPIFIVILVAIGVVSGFFIKFKGAQLWRW